MSNFRQNNTFILIVCFVISLHVCLLVIGNLWTNSLPKPSKQKIVVQTVRLVPDKPINTQAQISPPVLAMETPPVIPKKEMSLPVKEEPKEAPPIVQKKETPVPVKEEPKETLPIIQKKEPPLPVKEEPLVIPKKEPEKKPPPPIKKEAKTPPVVEKKKLPEKVNVEKKQIEKVATNKKREQEQASAEKKRQEQVNAEKKRQQQLAEEKKILQEIAAAEEAQKIKEQAYFNKAKENLTKMAANRNKTPSSSPINLETTNIPKELGALQVDAVLFNEVGQKEWGTQEVSYGNEVAIRLKRALRLPDYGAVKIQLTIDKTGKVNKLEIIQSESHKNRAYVETKIPTLLFPPFGPRFKEMSQNTFTIMLQNDY